MPQALIKITGLVQGVFFRATAREQAQKLNLTGYAKNLPDGSVESLVQGPKPAIEEYLQWCHQGPEASNVESVQVCWQEQQESLTGFECL